MAENTAPMSLPNWLNGDFLEKQLQNYYTNQNLKLVNYDVKPATVKGDNYCSSMYRVTVYYTDAQSDVVEQSDTRVINLIVKAALDIIVSDEYLSYDMYSREMDFYVDIGTQINALLRRLGERQHLLAELIGACRMNKVLILEDMKDKAYQCYPLERGFDLSEAKIALRKMALFHAICAHLNEQHPQLFDHFRHGAIEEVGVFDKVFLSQYDALVDVVSQWSDFEGYVEKLRRFRNNVMGKEREGFKLNPNHFNALIHGDLWINNIMIRSTIDKQVENMVFIDFQFACWGSSTVDLHHLMSSSSEESVRRNSLNELIESYHSCLVEYLSRLEYSSIPTFEEFQREFNERNIHGFIISCLEQPPMKNEIKADLETLAGCDEHAMEYKRLCYRSPQMRDQIRYSISYYDRLGVFD